MIQYYIGRIVVDQVDVTITRTSDTTYLIEAVGPETVANLVFKKESGGTIDDRGLQILPYTFTHTVGEVWEVSGDGGVTYETAWGIDIPSGSYLEEDVMNSMDFPDYIYIDYYLNAVNNSTSRLMVLANRIHMSSDQNRWGITQSAGGVGLWTTPSSEALIKLLATQGWSIYEMKNRGYEIEQSSKELTDITPTDPPYDYFTFPDSGKKFRMGTIGGGSGSYHINFVGKYQSYTHGTEVFSMQEGTGTQTVGSNGTVLNLMGNANWVKL